MPKESNQPKSDCRALRRLDPYNTSPREEENPERSSHHSSGEKARSRPSQSPSRSETRCRSRSPSEPPQWARELLKNQEEYRKEIKSLQSEIERLCRRGMAKYRNMPSNMWGTKNNTMGVVYFLVNVNEPMYVM